MRQSSVIRSLIIILCLGISACTKEKRNASNNLVLGTPGASNLASLQSDIFTFGCATSGCHDNRATPAANLNMSSAAQSYANLVSRLSTQATSRYLVVPSDPGGSYLIDKLNGTHLVIGGSGVRMPLYAAALTAEDLDRIVTWISNGAPND